MKKLRILRIVDAEGNIIGFRSAHILSQSEAAAGVTLVAMEKGGPIRPFVEIAKHLAAGGGTDTVPIMATPGEYLIKKGMVDFIRKTGMVTGGLVKAIGEGLPTPNPPRFAVGGAVGSTPGSIVFGPSSIVISCKYLDWKTVNEAGDKIFDVVKRKAGNLGWDFARR
jgi:hypothetical protein